MQVTEGLVIDACAALGKAGSMGMTLGELAGTLWPDTGVRSHGAVGSVLAELQRRGLATVSPGGKRRRAVLSEQGRRWIESGRVVQDAADAAELLQAPRAADALEAAIQSVVIWPDPPAWMPRSQVDAIYDAHFQRMRDVLRRVAGDDETLYEAALAEARRRLRRNLPLPVADQRRGA